MWCYAWHIYIAGKCSYYTTTAAATTADATTATVALNATVTATAIPTVLAHRTFMTYLTRFILQVSFKLMYQHLYIPYNWLTLPHV